MQAVFEDTCVLIVLIGEITCGRQDALREECADVFAHLPVDALIHPEVLLLTACAGTVWRDQTQYDGRENAQHEGWAGEGGEKATPEAITYASRREAEHADEEWHGQYEIQGIQNRCFCDGQFRELHMPVQDGDEQYDQFQGDAEENVAGEAIPPECLFVLFFAGQLTSPKEARSFRSDRSWKPGCNLRGGDPVHV